MSSWSKRFAEFPYNKNHVVQRNFVDFRDTEFRLIPRNFGQFRKAHGTCTGLKKTYGVSCRWNSVNDLSYVN